MRLDEIVALVEAARIQHAEDIVFWEGAKGAHRALAALESLASSGHKSTTIKFDGSPAVIFGRNEKGQFIFTDKSGFGAKGYDGKSKSPRELEQMLLTRGKEVTDSRRAFAKNMRDVFSYYEKATPKSVKGFFKGDLLYYRTPELVDGYYVFKPNVVTYSVKADSALGQQIANSKTGIVIHRYVDFDGNETSLPSGLKFQGTDVLVIPPIVASKPAKVSEAAISKLKSLVSKSAASIDKLLNEKTLSDMKVSDFADILYTYLNSKVDTGLSNLGADFDAWLSRSKVSQVKQGKIREHIAANSPGWKALWAVISGIMQVKDKIINEFDKQDSDIKASINNQPGGEGYVLAHNDGDIKLVNRSGFTAANRAMKRD